MKKIDNILIILLIVLLIVFASYIFIENKKKDITRPDYEPVASVLHSERVGIDAGSEYSYDIYQINKDDNSSYYYIKSSSDITIVGSRNKKDIDSGIINKKDDLKKIEKDINKDKEKDTTSSINYYFNNNGEYENLESIDALIDRLFK